VKKSTESLSFLRVFLTKKSCHPQNSTLQPFFRKTNAAIAFGRPKNLGVEVFVTNVASTSRQTPRRSSRRTTTHGKLEVENDRSAAKSAATCHFQPITYCHVPTRHITVACPVIDKSATTSVPRVTKCHIINPSPNF